MSSRDQFSARVEDFQHLFGLDNWTITILHTDTVEDHQAKTLADPRYCQASITIWPKLLSNESIWDEILMHEFIHILMAQYDFYVDNLGKEIKNDKGEIITDELFFIARENAVSQITSVMMRIYATRRG